MARAGLKKVQKTVRGKRGSVKRSYWVKSNPKESKPRLRAQGEEPKKPGFLRRHAGKIAIGAATVGLLALNRHKIGGALKGIAEARRQSKSGEGNGFRGDAAHGVFAKAREGWAANRSKDVTAQRMTQGAAEGMKRMGERTAQTREKVTAYRRTVGADLAGHMTRVGGEAAAHHIGSHFGTVSGTALGGMAAGPMGAGIGGFLGGQAGGFLANRHTEKHITRAANWVVGRLQR
jgi:hypothetical protein